MFGIDKVSLSLSTDPVFLIIAILLFGFFTLFVYRFTIPVINKKLKALLITLRFLALLLLLFMIFEPALTLTKKITINPLSLVFIDNSRSIKIKDGTNREQTVKDFTSELKQNINADEFEAYTFGNKVAQLTSDEVENLNFTEGSTNFLNIFSLVSNQNKNISSIVIISDGVITEGTNPLFTAEKLHIPVYTIGVGDTSRRNDIEIKNVIYNEYIYTETPTTIQTNINNTGFVGKEINVSLFDGNMLVEQKKITLSKDGIQNVEFEYNPKSGGEKKLTVVASDLAGEFTKANNKKVFYINVLGSKINILLLGGSPSPDISFIKESIEKDQNFKVNSLTQYAPGKFLEKSNPQTLLDSANIFFLIGFPSNVTTSEFYSKVKNKILNEGKPFFISLASGIDFRKLTELQKELPINISLKSNFYRKVQPVIAGNETKNPLLQNNSQNPIAAWENLPPVFQPDINFTTKPESELIATTKMNNIPSNVPLIVSRKLGNKRSIAVLAKDIWKWKLQTATKNLDLFDRFINSSVKWLNTREDQKQVSIKTSKRIYSLGEEVEFTGQVYDATFNPVSDAEVKVNITSNGEKSEIILNSVGNGLYEGTFQTNKPADYSFSGEANLDKLKLGTDAGSFNIGEVDIEMVNPRMNYEFLKSLADRTGGEYFDQKNFAELFPLLKKINEGASKEKLVTSEISLWSTEWLMVAIILLFAAEWFLRKRAGML